MNSSNETATSRSAPMTRIAVTLAVELAAVGLIYFALAKAGLALASINPSATPIWPATGFALAAILLRGYRIAPAILIAASAANAITAGSLATSVAIGIGNMLEGVIGAWLISRWSLGRQTFSTPSAVSRFSLIVLFATMISATVGASSLALAGYAEPSRFGPIWLTWWLGDLAGALVITPVVMLWALSSRQSMQGRELTESLTVAAVSCAIGLIAFSPLMLWPSERTPIGFLAAIPLLWSALRRGQRDTATGALIICGFAVWGTVLGVGPFAEPSLNESFLLLLMFMISITVPSLALSADAAVRRATEAELLRIQEELNERVERRTAALMDANRALQSEIDRRKSAEADLEQQRRYLVEAQRLANLGSWVRDVETGAVTWSDQLYKIYGLQPHEFAGTYDAVMALVHPDDRDRAHAVVSTAVISGEGFRTEKRIIRPSGEIRHVQNLVEPIKDDTGRVVRLIGISQDVTERRASESELERTREQLAQMQKLEAIAQLTGGIAHDFNNLLMVVSGHAEMLRRKLGEPKQLAGLDAVLGAARRGENLTRQLLTFSRRQPLYPVAANLRERIEALQPMLLSSLHGDISLVVDLPDDLWPAKIDVAEFELALLNIAVNARDAMPRGGTFTVSACNVTTSAGQPGQPRGDRVELSLADTGSGIAPDTIQKIFDPYFTTKAVGKGTGLGLSQVYGFATQSGGSVGVASAVGRGTTITLRLPRTHMVAQQPEVEATTAPAQPASGTVLVVEDNADVGDVTASLLEQAGYRVLRAENATQALERLGNSDDIDLLFSDIVMPNGMNGIHLAQEVSARYPRLGVLLTTGYSEVAESAQTRFPILRKPFEAATLERAVSDALASPRGGVARRAHG